MRDGIDRSQPRNACRGTRPSTHWLTSLPPPFAAMGPDSVGFYISGQLLTEDYYVFNKLAKGLIGTNNIDTIPRLCMSSAVTGYKATLGADAPPACYDDLNHAELIVIAGSNATWAHPILYRRLRTPRANPNLTVVLHSIHGVPRRPVPPICTCQSCPVPTWRCSTPCCTGLMLGDDAIRWRVHRCPHRRFLANSSHWCECTPAWAARICGVRRGHRSLRWRNLAAFGSNAFAVLPGAQPVIIGHGQECRADQPSPATGQIGAGRRSVLADRTARTRWAAVRWAAGQPVAWASRRHRTPDHRAKPKRCGMCRLGRISATPGKTAVEMFDAVKRGDIKFVDCLHQSRTVVARFAIGGRGVCQGRVRDRAGSVQDHRNRAAGRRVAASIDLGKSTVR